MPVVQNPTTESFTLTTALAASARTPVIVPDTAAMRVVRSRLTMAFVLACTPVSAFEICTLSRVAAQKPAQTTNH
jgi:hypothetical protein